MKKRLIAAAIALGLITAGIVGGTILADDDGENGSKGAGLVERVAEILGLEEETVQDAFDQARGEIRDEDIENRLAGAVEKGALTQEQADALSDWYDARPEDLPRLFGRGFGFWSEEKLASAVEKGVLTQEQADALSEWYDDRPEDLPDGFGIGKKFGHKGRGFFRGGHHKFEKKSTSRGIRDRHVDLAIPPSGPTEVVRRPHPNPIAVRRPTGRRFGV